MKLQQLKFLLEIEKEQLNISKAAAVLCTSQSGISKQIMLLEQELDIHLFERKGRKLISITKEGRQIIDAAKDIFIKVDDIKQIAETFKQGQKSIAIATTHTQARYVLPKTVDRFLSQYPDINLTINQGTPIQVADLLEQGDVDIAIATEVLATRKALVAMPCYQWNRCIITCNKHPLNQLQKIQLADIVNYPIITYVQGFTGRASLDENFEHNHLTPNIVLTAVDADVIKTYVKLGLGIGIIAEMAYNSKQDTNLVAHDVSHLFGSTTSQIAIKKDKYIKPYIYNFIEMFAPHLNQTVIKQSIACNDHEQRNVIFQHLSIPFYETSQYSF